MVLNGILVFCFGPKYWFKTEDLAQAEQCLVLCLRLEFYNTNVSSFCEENGIAGLSVRPMAFVIIEIKGPCIPKVWWVRVSPTPSEILN